MKEDLSRKITDLLAKSRGGKELSSDISRLRDEIEKEVRGDDAVLGTFTTLLESFREVIPDHGQRYRAAVKAMSATSKVGPQEVLASADKQVERLKAIEKIVLSADPAWRNELKAMQARLKETRDEMAKLRKGLAGLEAEETRILAGMATLEKDTERADEAVQRLFADLGSELDSVRKLIRGAVAERPAPPPAAPKDSPRKEAPAKGKAAGGQKGTPAASPPPEEKKWQKECPMCRGVMNYHVAHKFWLCYTCGNEETEAPAKGDEKGAETSTAPPPALDATSDLIVGPPPFPDGSGVSALSGGVREETRKPAPPKDQAEARQPRVQPPSQTKTCPVCRRQMSWSREEAAWHCSYCHYSRSV